MFKKTYGTLYEQNAYVFTDLFKELENYYAKGTVSHELMSKNLELSSLSRTNAFTFLIDEIVSSHFRLSLLTLTER